MKWKFNTPVDFRDFFRVFANIIYPRFNYFRILNLKNFSCLLYEIVYDCIVGDSDEPDHQIPAQADHQFRGKLTRGFRDKVTTLNV
jgi:hypothetical protein